jgi:molybdate transport system substrate-binding protein
MRWKFFQVGLAALLFLVGCNPTASPPNSTLPAASSNRTTLTVLAAASLTEPFKELARLFESANPGVSISYNFAGSQQLSQQLANGSPADVFAGANQKQMDVAVTSGRVEADHAQPFVQNRLVVILPQDNPAGIDQLEDLIIPGLKIILAGQEVPVGQYSLEFLEKASADPAFPLDYQDQVLKNVVSHEDNVKAVLTKVTLGEADAGIVYSSDTSSISSGQVQVIEIPDHLNTIASYPIAVVSDSRHPVAAQNFIDLILSEPGQQILEKHGFIPISAD